MLSIRRHARWAALAIAPALAAGIAWAGSNAGQTKAKPAQKRAACSMDQHGQSTQGGSAVGRPGKAASACPMQGHAGKSAPGRAGAGSNAKAADACSMDPAECEKQMRAGNCETMMGGKASAGCAMTAHTQPSRGRAQRPSAPSPQASRGNHPPGCPMAPGK